MRTGQMLIGPNAALAFAREGYQWWDINRKELSESISFAGLQTLIARHWKFAAHVCHPPIASSVYLCKHHDGGNIIGNVE
jgi:L-2-hydroxyglutarate oxidase LhgO